MRYFKIISTIIAITILFSITACTAESSKEISLESGSTHNSVSISLSGVDRTANETVLEITWHNSGKNSIMYGENFSLEYWNGQNWEACNPKENTGFHSIGYSLQAGESTAKKYSTAWIYGILKHGTYRFKTDCYVYDTTEGTKCSLWTEFSLGSVPSENSGATAPDTALKPPTLLLQVGSNRGETEAFAYQWNFLLANGQNSAVLADPQQLPQAENMLVLTDCTQAYAQMDFTTWPDSVSVRCWPDEIWGEDGAESVPVEMDGKTFSLNPEAYVYEITATWNNTTGNSHGTARYYVWISTKTLMPRVY